MLRRILLGGAVLLAAVSAPGLCEATCNQLQEPDRHTGASAKPFSNCMTLPLDDILVVSVEQAVAAPLCTARLADAGARVIKVERADGDFARNYDQVVHGESAYFVWLNRGKESVVLDIKNPEDNALLQRIISRADVFIQNLMPGAMDRAGLGWESLRQSNPRLITCDISGYGENGPYRGMKAYDLLIQCETGLVAAGGGGPDDVRRFGVSVADICCGMNAFSGILQALIERGRSGNGKNITVSLFDGLAEWMTVPLLYQDYAGAAPQLVGLNHATIAPYGLYRTSDGKQLVLAVQNEREWRSFCTIVLGRPELAEDVRFARNQLRCQNRPELDAAISDVLNSLTGDELKERLVRGMIAFGSVNSVRELSSHPQLRRITVETPGGRVNLPAPPVISRGEAQKLRPVPALGRDTERVRREFSS